MLWLNAKSRTPFRLQLSARSGSSGGVTGRIASLYRHPIKGFTPEPIARARLTFEAPFPCDRIFAVEDGPSGFDPAAPAHISKTFFAVLAKIAKVGEARTAYDEASGVLRASAPGRPEFEGSMLDEAGREAFAVWLGELLGPAADGPLRVIPAPGAHRFLDHPKGEVSIVNLASVRDLSARLGHTLDPLRFRANLYVEGWPAWAENDWVGQTLALGGARARVFKPIVRCAATGVDPTTAQRDIDVVKGLFDNLGHAWCGVYVQVSRAGDVAVGDTADRVAGEATKWAIKKAVKGLVGRGPKA